MNILTTFHKKPQKGFSIAFGVMLISAMILGIYIAMSDKITNEIIRENNNPVDKTNYLSKISTELHDYYSQHAGEIDSKTEKYDEQKLLKSLSEVKYNIEIVSTERMRRTDLCKDSIKVNTPDCIEYHDFYVWSKNDVKKDSNYTLTKDIQKGIFEFTPPLNKNTATDTTCKDTSALDKLDSKCFVPFVKISGFAVESELLNIQVTNLQKLAQGFENYYAIKRKQNPSNNSLINYFRQEDGSYSDTYRNLLTQKDETVNRKKECDLSLSPHNQSDNRYLQQIPCIATVKNSFTAEYKKKTGKTMNGIDRLPSSMTTTDSIKQELDLFEDLRDLYDSIVYVVGLEPALLNTVWLDTINDRNVYFSNTGRSNYNAYPYSASFIALAPWFDGNNKVDGKPNGMYEIKAIATE